MAKPYKLVIVSTIEMTDEDLCQWQRWHKSQFVETQDFYNKLIKGKEAKIKREEGHFVSYQILKNKKIM